MPITGMNHAVLYVSDARRTAAFYSEILGFRSIIEDEAGNYVFMRAPASQNHHDIAFFNIGPAAPSAAGHGEVGLYHLAWEVPTLTELAELRDRLAAAGALVGASNHGANKSLYAKDPDGLEFEVMWLVPEEHRGRGESEAVIEPLDLERDIATFAALGYA